MPAPRASTTPPFEVNKRDLERARKRIEKFRGEPFRRQARVWTETGMDLYLKGPLKSEAPKGRTGLLSRSVRRRSMRRPSGYFYNLGIKSRAPHAGLVSKGHSYAGTTVKGNPYVANVIRRYEGRVFDHVQKEMRSLASTAQAF